ncbi:hypothetical protein ACFFIX_15875 [Metabacillus herbersteinensis]|uniref:Peptidase M50 domain-containing protein n=1 Tax=Metabacillus herbersteinensis TaxID=283816 RepID=A0ABV6GJ38_9BACI
MFGFDDFLKFIQAFFIIFPAVTLLHVLGHIFFAKIFGGKEIKVVIGCGKRLFSIGFVEIRKYYFWYGGCEYNHLTFDNRLSHSLIFLGGSLFNLVSIFIVNQLIWQQILEPSIFWHQFIYFSFYFIFFALLPMEYENGSPSDGKALYRLIRNKDVDKSSSDCQGRR